MLSAVNALSDDDWRVYAVGDILEKNTKEVQYSKRMSEPTKKKSLNLEKLKLYSGNYVHCEKNRQFLQ